MLDCRMLLLLPRVPNKLCGMQKGEGLEAVQRLSDRRHNHQPKGAMQLIVT